MDNDVLKASTDERDRELELSDEDLEGVVGGLARPWLATDESADWNGEAEPGF
jgi:hypothetical protein